MAAVVFIKVKLLIIQKTEIICCRTHKNWNCQLSHSENWNCVLAVFEKPPVNILARSAPPPGGGERNRLPGKLGINSASDPPKNSQRIENVKIICFFPKTWWFSSQKAWILHIDKFLPNLIILEVKTQFFGALRLFCHPRAQEIWEENGLSKSRGWGKKSDLWPEYWRNVMIT